MTRMRTRKIINESLDESEDENGDVVVTLGQACSARAMLFFMIFLWAQMLRCFMRLMVQATSTSDSFFVIN